MSWVGCVGRSCGETAAGRIKLYLGAVVDFTVGRGRINTSCL